MSDVYTDGYLDTEFGAVEYQMVGGRQVLLRGTVTVNGRDHDVEAFLTEVDWEGWGVVYLRAWTLGREYNLVQDTLLKAWKEFVTPEHSRLADLALAEEERDRRFAYMRRTQEECERATAAYNEAVQRVKELADQAPRRHP